MASTIPGIKELLMGAPGSGKTYSIQTLLDCGLEVFALFLEQGMDALPKSVFDNPKFHWRYIPPATAGWNVLMDNAKKINQLSNDALQKMSGVNKDKYTQFIEILVQLNDFKDQNGKSYGDVCEWGTDRVLVIDGLTGLNKASKNLTVGSKPVITQPDWGVMMDNLERFIEKLCSDLWCHFVLTAHIEPERDETSGAIKNMVSTLGRKLAPTLPAKFSDVILQVKNGDRFTWDTVDAKTDLKARNLPLKSGITPHFREAIDPWKRKGGSIEAGRPQMVMA